MASIRKRTLPSGKIVWQCDYRDGGGARRSRQFPMKKDADAFLVKARSEVAQGIHAPDSTSITIAEAAALWLARGASEGLEQSTLDSYGQHVELHIKPLIGATKLSRMSVPSVQAFADELSKTRSRAMVKRVITSLSGIFSEAQRRGLAAQNPVSAVRIRMPKRDVVRPEMPSKEELRAILQGAKPKWKPLIWTATFTGLRGSELRGLKWEDVDLKEGILHVRRRLDKNMKFGPPKSEAGTRDIPLAPSVVTILREWKLACPKSEHDLVFPNGVGNPEHHQNILNRGFFPLQMSVGVTIDSGKVDKDGNAVMKAKYSLHALRHAAAALFIEQGMKPKRVQALMGHSSIQITFDLYGYLFPSEEEDQAAMKAIEARLIGK